MERSFPLFVGGVGIDADAKQQLDHILTNDFVIPDGLVNCSVKELARSSMNDVTDVNRKVFFQLLVFHFAQLQIGQKQDEIVNGQQFHFATIPILILGERHR
jgi:hypothetical protein